MKDTEHASIVEAVLALGDTLATRHPSVEEIAERRRQTVFTDAMRAIETAVDEGRALPAIVVAARVIEVLGAAGLAVVARQPD